MLQAGFKLVISWLGLPNGEISGNVLPHESCLRGLSRGLVRIGRQRREGLKFYMFILIGPNKSYICGTFIGEKTTENVCIQHVT